MPQRPVITHSCAPNNSAAVSDIAIKLSGHLWQALCLVCGEFGVDWLRNKKNFPDSTAAVSGRRESRFLAMPLCITARSALNKSAAPQDIATEISVHAWQALCSVGGEFGVDWLRNKKIFPDSRVRKLRDGLMPV